MKTRWCSWVLAAALALPAFARADDKTDPHSITEQRTEGKRNRGVPAAFKADKGAQTGGQDTKSQADRPEELRAQDESKADRHKGANKAEKRARTGDGDAKASAPKPAAE